MDRDVLIRLILSARTDDELAAAEDAADRWMAEHPDDFGVVMALDQVARIRDARNRWTGGEEGMRAGDRT